MIRAERAADGDYRIVTLDRPAARNALTPADLDALAAAVAEADEPVVLLRGAGSAFCAGADLDVVADLDDPAAFAAHGQRVASTIESADPVVLAGVDGAARGGGVELALACDLRVATPAATFAETGVALGLFGAWGGTARLPRVVGEGAALDIACSARILDAETALNLGLVSRVVADPETVAREVADNDHDAVAAVRRLVRAGSRGESAEATERAEREAFARLHAEQFGDGDRGR
ncbi:enoyl-CoA hydratase/isomerase family protein [Halobaculum sp. CBA1158]|uniref:enoyl-CoA hydratase/isomerase family protein n=1 Tax=Halobaculum sp. CBA1158 TaxID=2904243 RepID=UPI001F306CBE|nr:enoyl-CoA hydratase/isomerase family protein [Halobaculum sp. CBA1158]UIO99655.1 enoyl-CoA hydratase/isomerase family protein [Halobaculum sp. CBA1158]